MTETSTAGRRKTERKKHYRQLMGRSVGAGVVGFFAATGIWLFLYQEDIVLLAGLGVYYLGFAGHLLVWQLTSVTLFDEREQQIENDAGGMVMNAVMVVTIIGIPAQVVLEATETLTIPAAVQGAIWGYLFLVIGYLLVYGYISRKYS
ncbi:hypothetical protein ACLI4Z_18755 [Natrialbaceae archaeon A-arb3/5]